MSWTLLMDREVVCQVFAVVFQQGSGRFCELIGGAGGTVQFRGDGAQLEKAASRSAVHFRLQAEDRTFTTIRPVRYLRSGDITSVTAFFGDAAPEKVQSAG